MIRILCTLIAVVLFVLSSCRCATPPAPAKETAKVAEDAGAVAEDAAVKAPASAPASVPAAVQK